MSFDATVFKIMLASPSDVSAERATIVQTIHGWNDECTEDRNACLIPIRWEKHIAPELGGRPQGLINEHLVKECDILIAVFWGKFGSDTGKEPSGTVEEIKEFLNDGKLVILYFSNKPLPQEHDENQWRKLKEFKATVQRERLGIYGTFDGTEDLREKLRNHLNIHISRIQKAAQSTASPTVAPMPIFFGGGSPGMIPTTSSQSRSRDLSYMVSRRRVEDERSEFEETVRYGNFHGVKLQPCTIAISIIPGNPRPKPLRFAEVGDEQLRRIVRPIGESDDFRIERFRDQAIGVVPLDPAAPPAAVAQLNAIGSISSVAAWERRTTPNDKVMAFCPSAEWPALVDAVRCYLDGQSSLGVVGPVYIRLALLSFAGTIAVPEFKTTPYDNGRMNTENVILLEPIGMTNPGNPVPYDTVDSHLAAPLSEIWLHYGWPGVPQTDTAGRFTHIDPFGSRQ